MDINKKHVIIGVAIFLILILFSAIFFFLPNRKKDSKENFTFSLPKIFSRKEREKTLQEQKEKEEERLKLEWDNIEKTRQELTRKAMEIDEKEQKLLTLENEITITQEKLDTNIENLKSVAKYYEMMEPSRAAEIMENLEDEFIIQLMQNMKKDSASRILEELDPKKAASITKKMGGR